MPTEAATAATPKYTRTHAALRLKVTGRRETFKRGWLDPALAALLYLADGVADLDLGNVLQRAAEHRLEIRAVAGALRVHAEAADLDAVAEHLPEDALEVLLHLADARDAERGGGVEEAGDGEPLLDLRDLGLGLHALDRAQRFAGVRVPDRFALGGVDLEDHALAHAVRASAVDDDLALAHYLRYLALDDHEIRLPLLLAAEKLRKDYIPRNRAVTCQYNPSHDRKTDSESERAHRPGGEAPADLGRPKEYAPPGARAGTGSGPDLRLQPPRVGKSSHKSAHAYDDGRKVKAK